jgi:ketosteroid isomerase-like protein
VIDAAATSVAELSARVAEAFRGRENSARLQGREVPAESRREAPAPSTVPSPPAPAAVPPPVPAAPVEAAPTAPVLPPSPAAPQPSATVRPPDTPPRVDPPRAEPPPAAPAADNDDTAIRQVIAAYGRAIEAKDLRLFRSIKPNLTAEEERRLEEGFRAVTSQRVSLTVISLERKGDRATALVRRRDEIVAGGRKQTTDARQAFTLTKNAAGWVISEIR